MERAGLMAWFALAASAIIQLRRDPDLLWRLGRRNAVFRRLTVRSAFAFSGGLLIALAVLVAVFAGMPKTAFGPGLAGGLLLAAAIWLAPSTGRG